MSLFCTFLKSLSVEHTPNKKHELNDIIVTPNIKSRIATCQMSLTNKLHLSLEPDIFIQTQNSEMPAPSQCSEPETAASETLAVGLDEFGSHLTVIVILEHLAHYPSAGCALTQKHCFTFYPDVTG